MGKALRERLTGMKYLFGEVGGKDCLISVKIMWKLQAGLKMIIIREKIRSARNMFNCTSRLGFFIDLFSFISFINKLKLMNLVFFSQKLKQTLKNILCV